MNWVKRFPVRSNLNDTKMSKFIGIVKVYICNCGICFFCRSNLACYVYGITVDRRNTFFQVVFRHFIPSAYLKSVTLRTFLSGETRSLRI